MSSIGDYKEALPGEILKDLIKELEGIRRIDIITIFEDDIRIVDADDGNHIEHSDLQAIIDKYKPLAI